MKKNNNMSSEVTINSIHGETKLTDQTIAMDPVAVRLYEIAKLWSLTNEVNAVSVVEFVTTLIRALEDLVTENKQGQRKKKILMTVIRLVIQNEIKMLEADKQMLLTVVETVVPTLIDTVIGVATGSIDIHKKWNTMFGGCCPCPSKK